MIIINAASTRIIDDMSKDLFQELAKDCSKVIVNRKRSRGERDISNYELCKGFSLEEPTIFKSESTEHMLNVFNNPLCDCIIEFVK